ncbi:MAG: diaminopimelate epimerase [Omnitrophica WOR_2 bacterium GWF2_43_52]|nr:MAG: diaminopimelate epimerase [Omnitrophica WOR_2 bacterium GWA2_44_7]OGX16079.1 MAG: diaminopimelate epimerase [Omnitrophica WOR_2 bacterium GWC2_44_8]OGX21420.1 MAG: diaminopimelate epimerase [Omnitrophica WOR_2 bacterium GWF2_43_52]HAH21951.1 diaminopimelate epimerase [Candidatus Omnitrophota bacterium]HBG62628.1 diaminopimelate epimerase [Candidatus Omnitrophota bacterium]
MRKIAFAKVVASGNDFIVIESNTISSVVPALPARLAAEPRAGRHRPSSIVKALCDRKFGVGADGLLLLEKSKIADIRMRILNADGSEAEMCGNGARCIALYYIRGQGTGCRGQLKIETKAGIIEGKVSGNSIKIKLTDPKDYQPGVPIKIQERELRIHSINTGVPHAVIFVEGIEEIDVSSIGREIRYYERFAPAGTNVDFVEVISNDTIKVRTYERGVEDETLACGTGAVASAIVYGYQLSAFSSQQEKIKINVVTQGGETLKVYFKKEDNDVKDVWLEGKAKIVYKGEIVI